MIKMNVYEIIFEIIDKHGPVPFSTLLQMINQMNDEGKKEERKDLFDLSQLKTLIEHRKDLFTVKDDIVSIREEKEIVSFIARIWGDYDPSYTIHVDFSKNNFAVFEFFTMEENRRHMFKRIIHPGEIDRFKRELYRLNIWDWEKDYQPEELLLDGICWYVELKTKGNIYVSNGFQSFPREWNRFCRALSKFVGKKIC